MRASGFSLIEFIVVLGIIAIVNIAMLPRVSSIKNSAKIISSKSVARNAMIALEQYYFVHQAYPIGDNMAFSILAEMLVNAEIFDEVPKNPFTGTQYSVSDESGQIYYVSSENSGYELVGYGDKNEDVIFEF